MSHHITIGKNVNASGIAGTGDKCFRRHVAGGAWCLRHPRHLGGSEIHDLGHALI